MQKNQPNVDGFVVRRRQQNSVQPLQRPGLRSEAREASPRFLNQSAHRSDVGAPFLRRTNNAGTPAGEDGAMALPRPTRQTIDLDLTLDEPSAGKKTKSHRRTGKLKLPSKKIVKWVLIALAAVILGVGAWLGYKFISNGGKVFQGGGVIPALFTQARDLKEDAEGRSNVLLFGTSEDDPGHDGAELTDSMMIASVNQKTKDVFLISIPRDLYIDYGRACFAGYKGKINAFYSCVKEEDEQAAQAALRAKVGEIFGLDIQYSVHLNYTALRQAVDAVGGITVVIDSVDERGILDRNFDWDCPKGLFTCYNVKYPNGPAQLNGKQALYLARARGANGLTYGLPQANFDREKYQRLILVALKDKAVSAGTLANPVAVSNLLDALGNNVRTSFDAEEVKTLVKLGQDIKSEDIHSLALNDPEDSLVTTDHVGNESIVRPRAGLYDYSQIQRVVDAYATGDLAVIEGASIDVLNASGQAGAAQTQANKITENKLEVNVVGNAPVALGTKPFLLYDLSGGKKPATLKKLQTLFGITISEGAPAGVSSNADFVLIVGPQPEAEKPASQ